MGHEIYRVLIQENEFSSIPNHLTFKKVADICFTEYQAVIFALEIEVKGQTKSIVRLNPSLFEFSDWQSYNYYLYVICEDELLASQVQKLEMNDDKYEKYMGRSRTDKVKKDIFLNKEQLLGNPGDHLLSNSFGTKNGESESDDDPKAKNQSSKNGPKQDNEFKKTTTKSKVVSV